MCRVQKILAILVTCILSRNSVIQNLFHIKQFVNKLEEVDKDEKKYNKKKTSKFLSSETVTRNVKSERK